MAAIVAMACLATGVLAEGPQDRATSFATCTGRWSAVMEHEWLMGRDGSEAEMRRATFVTLLEAAMPDPAVDAPDLLHLRIAAKHALAHLLQQADLGTDPATARRARAMARNQLAPCRTLLLG
ncbi:hypothetical protein [Thetidibacter halocola]|uniref:Uncharacterized protein n=1 Tax=Thetidibacter halocola TaxID=2827239 RepID=A0A8J7W900_9RHOB|nr:hypothetical protein [Thetidibacter halocola]MBS0123175.1 hypothetical protein [Thetidibacter halocola]